MTCKEWGFVQFWLIFV